MQFSRLPVLQIHSKVHGLVKLNDTPAGETQGAPIMLPVSFGSKLMLSFEPFENPADGVYLPFTRQILLEEETPSILHNDGLISLCAWPDGMYEVFLVPPCVHNDAGTMPQILSSLEYFFQNKQYLAYVYLDRTYNFAVEDAVTHKILFAYGFPEPLKHFGIQFRRIGGLPFLLITGDHNGERRMLCVYGGLPVGFCFYLPFLDFHLDNDSLVLFQDIGDPFGRTLSLPYRPEQHSLVPGAVSIADHPAAAKTPDAESIAQSFLLAVKYGDSAYALSLLCSSLKEELSFPDLLEFFGDFSCITPNLFGSSSESPEIALKYELCSNISYTRIFIFEFSFEPSLSIVNISEK